MSIRTLAARGLSFAHLAGLTSRAARAENEDDERKQREGESDDDYAKRMEELDEEEEKARKAEKERKEEEARKAEEERRKKRLVPRVRRMTTPTRMRKTTTMRCAAAARLHVRAVVSRHGAQQSLLRRALPVIRCWPLTWPSKRA